MVRKEHNTPGIIKYLFWRMTAAKPVGEITLDEEIYDRGYCQ